MKYNKLNIFLDFFIFIFSLYFSLWLRFNGSIAVRDLQIFYKTSMLIAILKILIFYINKNYKIIIKHFSTYDVLNTLKSCVISTLLFSIGVFILKKDEFLYPRSVVIIDFFISFLFINIIRYIEKYFTKEKIKKQPEKTYNTLIVGAGEAGSMVLREIRNNPSSNMKVIGFIDDAPDKKGLFLTGKKILGDRNNIAEIVNKYKVKIIIIALPSASRTEINAILKICEKTSAKIKIVPSTMDVLKGEVKLNQIRDIKIEDLLNRDEIQLDKKKIREFITGKKILITGGGGSIGSEIARQTASLNPKTLLLLGKGENSIFNITMELQKKHNRLKIIPIIADIKDEQKIDRVLSQYKPDIIFHAAAHKHVYLMELHPDEAFTNNVLGTLNMANLAIKHKVKKFVLISTDKAVNPTSIMGSTKRIAEKIIIGLNTKSKNNTKFVAVRFGNVLGSRGSVVPIFKYQIESGGPVTVTHPEIKRYFMTIPEAVQLVLQAGSLGTGGEIFILDMGEPVKIVDLAKRMISLSGYEPDKDIKIKYIGLKPGEKMFEELILNKENSDKTKYEKIFIEKPEKINLQKLMSHINKIKNNLKKFTNIQTKKEIKKIV